MCRRYLKISIINDINPITGSPIKTVNIALISKLISIRNNKEKLLILYFTPFTITVPCSKMLIKNRTKIITKTLIILFSTLQFPWLGLLDDFSSYQFVINEIYLFFIIIKNKPARSRPVF